MENSNLDLLETSLAFVIEICSGEIDVEARKEELRQKQAVTKRRYAKVSDKLRALYLSSRDKRGDKSDKLARISKKKTELSRELQAQRHEYGAILAAELGVPLNYVLSSVAYVTRGETHLILGVLDPEVGPQHGHIVIGKDGSCRYLRLPTEEHGKANVINGNTSPNEAILDRIIQLSKKEDQS